MGMTLNDFEAKALQVLLSQRFLSLPLFEEEELSESEKGEFKSYVIDPKPSDLTMVRMKLE